MPEGFLSPGWRRSFSRTGLLNYGKRKTIENIQILPHYNDRSLSLLFQLGGLYHSKGHIRRGCYRYFVHNILCDGNIYFHQLFPYKPGADNKRHDHTGQGVRGQDHLQHSMRIAHVRIPAADRLDSEYVGYSGQVLP